MLVHAIKLILPHFSGATSTEVTYNQLDAFVYRDFFQQFLSTILRGMFCAGGAHIPVLTCADRERHKEVQTRESINSRVMVISLRHSMNLYNVYEELGWGWVAMLTGSRKERQVQAAFDFFPSLSIGDTQENQLSSHLMWAGVHSAELSVELDVCPARTNAIPNKFREKHMQFLHFRFVTGCLNLLMLWKIVKYVHLMIYFMQLSNYFKCQQLQMK